MSIWTAPKPSCLSDRKSVNIININRLTIAQSRGFRVGPNGHLKLNRLYDPVRKAWVKETPEERVRQKLLQILVRDLHFPLNMLAVEKELSQLPHLQLLSDIPKRRADILAFAKRGDDFWPLLMIECKAEKLTAQFANQLVGYNSFVQAPFLCLANEKEVVTGSFDEEAGYFRFEPGLKSYPRLLETIQMSSFQNI